MRWGYGTWNRVRPLTRLTKDNPITTTNGKGTTPNATFIKLAKAISESGKQALLKWCDAYDEYKKNGNGDKLAFAKKWESALRGSEYDIHTAGTIRVNLSHIEWAESNIKGGARSCSSIAHIIATKKPKTQPKPKDTTTYKVRTISGGDFVKELVANGVERKTALAIAKNMRFV